LLAPSKDGKKGEIIDVMESDAMQNYQTKTHKQFKLKWSETKLDFGWIYVINF